MNLSNYKTLGVLNRTPNSFSDKGLSLNPDYFKKQLQAFLDDPSVIVDIGFESTAPMNSPVTFEEEKKRFDDFLHASREFSFNNRFISFDTYKIKNFELMVSEFRKIHPQTHFIFNDVSGVLDEELKKTLLKFKDEKFYYIFTSTHIPDRSQVLDHMKFLDEKKDIIDQTATAFKRVYEWFKALQMQDQLILDPGFGFSKTYEQNWRLIDHYKLLDDKISTFAPENYSLIGLSKKSFLRKALGPGEKVDVEELHRECIKKIRKSSRGRVLFRVHDSSVVG